MGISRFARNDRKGLSPRAPFYVAPSEARGLPVGRRPERRGGSLGTYAPRDDKKEVVPRNDKKEGVPRDGEKGSSA